VIPRATRRFDMPEFHVHWLTVGVGTVAYFILGAIWYGALAGPWRKALG